MPDSPLAKLLVTCVPLPPHERALALENSKELEEAHAEAAKQGQSAVPNSAEAEVDFHYVCFVTSHKNDRIYELDGDKKGPIDSGYTLQAHEDILSERGLTLVRNFMQREKENSNFGLLALVDRECNDQSQH